MNFREILIAIFELSLLLTAYQITTRRDIHQVVDSYRLQSFLLTITAVLIAILESISNPTTITGLFTSKSVIAIVLIAFLPLALGLLIRWVLVRATIYEPKSGGSFWRLSNQQKGFAQSVWLEQRYSPPSRLGLIFSILTVLAFAIVFLGIEIDVDEKIGISVSLTLHLVGLYNTFLRKDILSQVIGVLTMDQGMYLAIVKIVNIPVPATLFVIALYFYTIITIIILFIIVPQLRHAMGSIDLEEIVEKSELKG